MGFLKSRWVELPDGVSEADGATLPAGFRASGVSAGVKASGLDLGLLVCDSEQVVSAARFTRNAVIAAPVELNLAEAGTDILRAVVVNSGNANVSNGEIGLAAAKEVRDTAADALGLGHSLVGVASTGVIGEPPPVEKIASAVPAAVEALSQDGGADFANAIMTTDAGPKFGALTFEVAGKKVTITGQAKGGGMIAPAFSSATLIACVQTDAILRPEATEKGLDGLLAESFERVTVDAQMSTNDSFFLMASGESGVNCTDEPLFFEAIEALMVQLALELVTDGEGATKVIRLQVDGAHSDDEAERVCRAVSDSPLVKTAAFGEDPNWGRVIQAVGAEIGRHAHGREILKPSLWIEDQLLCDKGVGVVPPSESAALKPLMEPSEIEFRIDLHRGHHSSMVYFSDMTYDYVKINAEYTS